MSAEQNVQIARRFLEEAYTQGNVALLDELLARNYLDNDAPPGTPTGVDGIKYLVRLFREAFPDLRFIIKDQLADGDKVALRYVFQGTHRGNLFGIPASGKSVSITGISIYRVAGGQLQEAWVNYDMMGLMQQIGAVPMPGQ